jgi:hypothetical protein
MDSHPPRNRRSRILTRTDSNGKRDKEDLQPEEGIGRKKERGDEYLSGRNLLGVSSRRELIFSDVLLLPAHDFV